MGRKISQDGIDLIRRFEGEELTAYLDAADKLTVGVGHLVRPGEPYKLGRSITKAESERLLRADLAQAERAVETLVRVPLSENQFAALVSLVFNIGRGNFDTSTLLRKLNRADYQGAADEFLKWVRAGGRKLKGLERRRAAERRMFLTNTYTAASRADGGEGDG